MIEESASLHDARLLVDHYCDFDSLWCDDEEPEIQDFLKSMRFLRFADLCLGDFQHHACLNDVVAGTEVAHIPTEQVHIEKSFRQAKIDTARDTIQINGVHFTGAEIGVDGIIQELVNTMEKCIQEADIHMKFSSEALVDLARAILIKASRSTSGGHVLFHLHDCLKNCTALRPIAASHLAPPLRIRIYAGSFQGHTPALICACSCVSFYHLQAQDEAETSHGMNSSEQVTLGGSEFSIAQLAGELVRAEFADFAAMEMGSERPSYPKTAEIRVSLTTISTFNKTCNKQYEM